MILVDIYSPSVNQTYDFSLEEGAKISQVIDEISEMIAQKEQTGIEGDVREFLLVSRNLECILNPEKTLAYYEIRTGDKLVLV